MTSNHVLYLALFVPYTYYLLSSERLSADSPPSTTRYVCHFASRSMILTRSSREQNNLTPRLSTEVWETIIDHVASIFDRGRTRNLAACARVCHAWVPRAKMHLFRFIATGFLKKRTFLSLENSVRSKPFLLKYTRNVSIRGIQTTADVETTRFLVTRHMPNLEQCNISDLKLERSHPLLPRFPSGAKHVKKLVLTSCVTEDINQLGRFVTSFRSLSTFILFLDDDWSPRLTLSHLQFNRPKCSLSCLTIKALSGISVLLGYFITAHPFISHLKHLLVSWSYDKLDSVVREITDLLHHCSQSLEELTLILGSVFVSYYDYGLSGTGMRFMLTLRNTSFLGPNVICCIRYSHVR